MNMFSTGNPEEDELLRLLLQPRSVRARVREREMQERQDAAPLMEDPIVRGTNRAGRTIGSKPSLFDVGYTVKQGRRRGGRDEGQGQIQPDSYLEGPFPGEKDEQEYRERLIKAGASDPIAEALFAKQDFRDLASGMDATQRRSRNRQSPELQQPARPAMQPVEGGEIAPVGEGVEVSLLERLGLAIRNNPELAAMGAQLAGGLISNAAQNRAQRQADRTNQQRTARSNLISALTGGRVRPDVERAQADTGGFLSLNTLGQALRGGGAMVQGELARRVEEAERERRAGLEERAARLSERQAESLDNYRQATLKARAEEFEAQQQSIEQAAQREIKKQGEEQLRQLRANVKEIDDAIGLRKTGGYLDSAQGSKKLYGDMRVLFQQFEEDPNPANINGIIQVYQRMFDPATVREGDVALLREAEGSIKQAVAVAERILGEGGTISSYTIEQMKKAADDVHALQQKKAQEDVRAYVGRLFNSSEQAVLLDYYDDILSLQELPGSNLDDLRANIAEDLDNL